MSAFVGLSTMNQVCPQAGVKPLPFICIAAGLRLKSAAARHIRCNSGLLQLTTARRPFHLPRRVWWSAATSAPGLAHGSSAQMRVRGAPESAGLVGLGPLLALFAGEKAASPLCHRLFRPGNAGASALQWMPRRATPFRLVPADNLAGFRAVSPPPLLPL